MDPRVGDGCFTTSCVRPVWSLSPQYDSDDVLQTSIQGGLSGLILAWANELTGNDNESKPHLPSLTPADAHIVSNLNRAIFRRCIL